MKKYLLVAAVVTLITPLVTFASFNRSLSYGASGSDVTQLQDFLASENCLSSQPTGFFGLLTLSGVKCFQQKFNISPTGYFANQSRVEANSLIATITASSTTEQLAETGNTVPVVSGCFTGAKFNPLTGAPCTVPVTTPGCSAGALFNTQTGASCTTVSGVSTASTLPTQNIQTQQQTAPNTAPTITPTPPPITISVANPVCTSTTTSRLTVNTDWSKVYQVVIHFTGQTNLGNYAGGQIIQQQNSNDALEFTGEYGTLNYTVTANSKPTNISTWNVDYGTVLASSSGTITLPNCNTGSSSTQTSTPTPPTPITQPTATYYPITVGNYVINNSACVSKGLSGTFESISSGNLVTIGLNGTTTTPITLQPNDSISITATSPQNLNEIKFEASGYEYSFFMNGSGTQTVTDTGTGGSLGATPIVVAASWSDQEVPTTLDLTINSIKFADGTEVGGLPLTISGLGITKCSWSN